MAPDPDFEKQVFALYGEPSSRWPDGGVTESTMAAIHREERSRLLVLSLAVGVGALLSVILLALLGWPLIVQVSSFVGGAPLAGLWCFGMAAIFIGGLAARPSVNS